MYKDVLEKLQTDRRVNDAFIERLEKNGFETYRGKFEYWDSQPYVEIGLQEIWLVEMYYTGNGGTGCRYRNRNDVARDIKNAIELEQKKLEKEIQLVDEILPIK